MGGDGSSCVVRPAVPADAAAITRVHVRSWQTSYRGILPQDYLDNINFSDRHVAWKKALVQPLSAVYVAVASAIGRAQIVGFCSAGPHRGEPEGFRGEIWTLYLLEEAKRRGVGRALFTQAAGWLRQNRMEPMMVWVLKENLTARRFYEALGGKLVEEKTVQIGGKAYPEMAYGWRPP